LYSPPLTEHLVYYTQHPYTWTSFQFQLTKISIIAHVTHSEHRQLVVFQLLAIHFGRHERQYWVWYSRSQLFETRNNQKGHTMVFADPSCEYQHGSNTGLSMLSTQPVFSWLWTTFSTVTFAASRLIDGQSLRLYSVRI